MIENKIKMHETGPEAPPPEPRTPLFLRKADKYLKFVVFLVVVGLVYIWNAHMAEKQVRRKDQLNREIRELKSEYSTLNADMSFGTRQTEIAGRVDTLGLTILVEPPFDLTRK